MKIAMLGHKHIPSREGGVEIVVEELSARMVEKGHAVTAYNRAGARNGAKDLSASKRTEYKGVRLITVPTIDKKGLAAMTSSFFASIKAAFGPYDVVHFHAEGPCAMLWFTKLFGKRCIATVHGLDHQRAKWGRLAKTYILAGEKCAVRYADEIIVLSRNVQKYFRERYNRDTVFIPNGIVKPALLPAKQILELGLQPGEYILFLARIVPEKGIQYLIDAFKTIRTDKKLVIAGGASDTDAFYREMQQRAAGDDRIIFTGFVSGTLLEELYSCAYLYTLPSDLEGMPLSLLEAMSYGKCCVVSDIPECTEVVEDKGVVFPRGNTAALAEVLQKLCDHPEIPAGYGSEASAFVCAKYNWDEVTEKTLALYEKKTEKRGGGKR